MSLRPRPLPPTGKSSYGVRVTPVQSTSLPSRRPPAPECAIAAMGLYSKALELAREEMWDDARNAFEVAIAACPSWQKPWVSYAQMEKRAAREAAASTTAGADRWRRCRTVLQRALTLNPSSPQIIQAWGLMELQRSNLIPAVMLLERCASIDRACAPVLRWQLVREARKTVGSRKRVVG